MSTLRERIEALAKKWEGYAESPAIHDNERWAYSICASALLSALESETREALRSCLWHSDCDAADRALRFGVAPSHPPFRVPANTENDR